MVHVYERRAGDVAIVELEHESDARFAVVRLHDDGTVSAAARWDVSRHGLRRAPMTESGVESVATLRSKRSARVAAKRIEG